MLALLDMDGVIVNFIQGALDIHDIKYTIDEVYQGQEGEWDIVKILKMSAPAFWKPMNEEFWAKLEWMPDGEKILKSVESKFGQENVVLWTSPSKNYGCIDGKKRWIERHLPKHYSKPDSVIFGSRKEAGAPANLLIDDSNGNVDKFAAKGGRYILIPRIWNRNHSQRHNVVEVLNSELGGVR